MAAQCFRMRHAREPSQPGRPVLEPVEPRLLHSADPTPLGAAMPAVAAAVADAVALVQAGAEQQQAPARELVVVDARVSGRERLAADLRAQQAAGRPVDLLLLEDGQDGLQAIGEQLAGSPQQYSAIHLIAHGDDGQLALGSATLDMSAVRSRAAALAGWSTALTADADLLLYGCDVAAGPDGLQLVDALAALTGADVAASSDVTGAAALGGDWDLEVRTGAIDTALAPSAGLVAEWQGTLGLTPQAPGTETLVNTTTTGAQRTPEGVVGRQVSINASGQTAVVWRDDASQGIRLRVYDAQGAALTASEVTVDPFNPGNAQHDPVVLIDNTGRIAVAWTEINVAGPWIEAAIYDTSGSRLVAPVLVYSGNVVGQPALDHNPYQGGSLVVSWTSVVGAAGQETLFSVYTWNLVQWYSGPNPSLLANGDQHSGSGAASAAGDGLMVYEGDQLDGSGSGISGRLYTSLGQPNGGPFVINTTVTGEQTAPVVGASAAGDYVVVWVTETGGAAGLDIVGQRLDPAGNKVGGEFAIAQTVAGNQTAPSLDVAPDGSFVVAWQSEGQDGNAAGIYLRQFNAQAQPLTGDLRVNATTAGNQQAPTVAMSGARVVVTWSGNSTLSSPTDTQGVYLARYAVTPAGIATTATDDTTSEAAATGAFDVVLRSQPTADVTIALGVDDPTEGELSVISLTFTTANWNVPQTVSVRGRDDTVVDGTRAFRVTLNATSADVDYDGLTDQTAAFQNADNDTVNRILVDTDSDLADGDTSSIDALLASRGDDDKVSLREAIRAANATTNAAGGADVIEFDLSGTSHRIVLTSALDALTDPVLIDGGTAANPDYAGTPVIELASHNVAPSFNALTLEAGAAGSVVRNLVVNDILGSGIVVNAAGVIVERNRLGTDTTGTVAHPIRNDAVRVLAGGTGSIIRDNLIGSTSAESGVDIGVADGVQVTGNLIGVNATQTATLPFGSFGISMNGTHGTVVSGNVIGATPAGGIKTFGDTNVTIQGNIIGTDATGTLDFGGNGPGIALGDSSGLVGGVGPGQGNIIANAAQQGIVIFESANGAAGEVSLLGNRLWDNGFGIDLATTPTPNLPIVPAVNLDDPLDADIGPNRLSNAPVLTSAVMQGANLVVSGTLDAESSQHYRIELFFTDTPDASGRGQAQRMLGSIDVATDAAGHADFTATLPFTFTAGQVSATATRTDTAGTTFFSTSEFAANRATNRPPLIDPVATTPIEENSAQTLTLSATDADGDALSWSIVGGPAQASLSIDPVSGVLGFGTPPDFEQPGGTAPPNDYQVRVRVVDGRGGVAEADVTLRVTDVDEAPAWVAPPGGSILEDGVLLLSAANGNAVNLTDPDAAPGPVDVKLGASSGTLTLATTSGLTFTIGDGSNDPLMRFTGTMSQVQAALATLRFDPAPQSSGTATLTLEAVELANPLLGATANIVVTVGTVNDAPVLTPVAPSLALTEDTPAGGGQTVGTLVGTSISDADAGPAQGIAINAANAGNGSWQVSIDGGASWTDVGTVSDTGALLLRATDRLRFVPDAKNGTTATLGYRAWDQTSGVAGTTSNVSVNGGATAFSVTTDTLTANVASVNDAPVLVASAPALATLTEGQVGNAGQTVGVLVSLVSDVDQGASQGIAIVAQDPGSGRWEYSLDGAASWNAVGAVSAQSARLLRGGDLVRFVPSGENGTVGSLTFVAWDQTAGSAGALADASSGGGTSAFSAVLDVASVTVTGANDAPVLVASAPQLAPLDEDQQASAGQTLASFAAASITDVDAGALQGIAIVAADAGNGRWEYALDGGTGWNTLGTVSGSSALLLRASDQLRFVPDGNNGTTATLGYRAWDRTAGTAGSRVSTAANGGGTAFSSVIDTASVTASPVNDAPVLGPSAPMLASITEDELDNGGQTIASIIGSSIGDVDAGAGRGIAVVGQATGNGRWQYALDGSASWSALGTVGENAALLLRASDRVRFVPDGIDGTSASLTYRGWDGSTGNAGERVDASVAGGTSAFSTASAIASLVVTAVDDAPSVASSAAQTSPGTTITVTPAMLSASDVDTPGDQLVFTVTTPTTGGTLLRDGTVLAVGDRFTQADVVSGRVAYRAGAGSTGLDTIGLSLASGRSAPSVTAALAVLVSEPAPVVGTGGSSSGTPAGSASNTERDSSATSGRGTAQGDDATDAQLRGAAAAQPAPSPVTGGPRRSSSDAIAAPALSASSIGTAAGGRRESASLSTRSTEETAVALAEIARAGPGGAPRLSDIVPASGLPIQADAPAAPEAWLSGSAPQLGRQLDRVQKEMNERIEPLKLTTASIALASAGLSIGYVTWLLRGGLLLSSLLASMPAWRWIDPLPILDAARTDDAADDESLQQMLARRSADGGPPDARDAGPADGDAGGMPGRRMPHAQVGARLVR